MWAVFFRSVPTPYGALKHACLSSFSTPHPPSWRQWQARAGAEGRVFVAPYDDPYTIAGQGTIGNEILRQTNMDALDAIFVAVGGEEGAPPPPERCRLLDLHRL